MLSVLSAAILLTPSHGELGRCCRLGWQFRFHMKKGVDQVLAHFPVQPFGDLRVEQGLIAGDLDQDGLCGRQKMQTTYAPVVRVGTPLDHAARFEPVYQPSNRDRLDLAERGEFVLRETRLAV